ncbi:hypothetical protein CSA_023552, partial [Cucumis sativus]
CNSRHQNKQTQKKPCAILVHCFGGNSKSKWQFFSQVRDLSRCFSLYLPSTNKTNMSDVFLAICVGEGIKRLGVEKHSVVGKGDQLWRIRGIPDG